MRCTQEMIKSYQSDKAELAGLGREHTVTDTVVGSDEDYPYCKHTMTIKGVSPTDRMRELQERIYTVDRFIASLPQSRQRRLMRMRAEGKNYIQAAYGMKENKMPGTYMTEISRLLKIV